MIWMHPVRECGLGAGDTSFLLCLNTLMHPVREYGLGEVGLVHLGRVAAMHPVRECGLGALGLAKLAAQRGCTPCVNVGWELTAWNRRAAHCRMHPVRECGLGGMT